MIQRLYRDRSAAGLIAVLFLLSCFFTFSPRVMAAEKKPKPSPAAGLQAEAFNREAESLYRYVEEGHTEKAAESLRTLESLFEASSFHGLTGVEGIHALAGTILEMKEAIARVKIDPKHWMTAAGKLRLAADSLTHPKDGIWLQYYKLIREDIQRMDQRAATMDRAGMKKAFADFQEHFEMVRPSMMIVRKPEEVAMLESWISYTGGVVSREDAKEIRRITPRGEEIINLLFGKKKDEPALAPLGEAQGPWVWQLLFGAFILSALTFAGYRKYQGHKIRMDAWHPK